MPLGWCKGYWSNLIGLNSTTFDLKFDNLFIVISELIYAQSEVPKAQKCKGCNNERIAYNKLVYE